jgi:hypothetical protein
MNRFFLFFAHFFSFILGFGKDGYFKLTGIRRGNRNGLKPDVLKPAKQGNNLHTKLLTYSNFKYKKVPTIQI